MSKSGFSSWCFLALGLAPATLVIGCANPGTQLRSCQAEKSQLLAAIEKERTARNEAATKVASLEQRLDESEKRLAALTNPRFSSSAPAASATRFATTDSRRAFDLSPAASGALPTGSPRPAEPPQTAPASGLKWKPAREMSSPVLPAGPTKQPPPDRSSGVSSGPGTLLKQLADKDPRIEFDAKTGIAKVQLDLNFVADSGQLTPKTREQLNDLARWLQNRETADLRLVIAAPSTSDNAASGPRPTPSTSTSRQLTSARVRSIVEHVERQGISEQRLALVDSAELLPATNDASAPANSTVAIFLAEMDQPLLGQVRPARGLRR